jgi:ankyrin repeat protein
MNIKNDDNDTPTHLAFRSFKSNEGGDINTLKYLLNVKGIDVNMKSNNDSTILHAACYNINNLPLDMFQYLIETKGGDIIIQSRYHGTPIHLAFRCFDLNKGGDINILKYLLNVKGIDVNMKDRNDSTILHAACENSNGLPLDIFQYLIENKGLKLGYLDCVGNTPLHVLMNDLSSKDDSNVSQIAEYLIQQRIPINHKNSEQLTALYYCSEQLIWAYRLTYGVLIKNGAKLEGDC